MTAEQTHVAAEISDEQHSPAEEEATGITGTGWMYVVAALSLINTVIVVFGGEFSMIFGLTSTLIAAYMFEMTIAIVATVLFAGLFAGLAFMTSRGAMWALLLAIVLYLADAATGVWAVMIVGDDSMLLDLGAHAIVLWFMFKGVMQLREAKTTNAFGDPAVQGDTV